MALVEVGLCSPCHDQLVAELERLEVGHLIALSAERLHVMLGGDQDNPLNWDPLLDAELGLTDLALSLGWLPAAGVRACPVCWVRSCDWIGQAAAAMAAKASRLGLAL